MPEGIDMGEGFMSPIEKQDIGKPKIPDHFTQKDLAEIKPNKDTSLESLSDLVLVHKTDYIPQNSEIKTSQNSGVKYDDKVKILGKEYGFKTSSHRNTLHFSVNGEVGDISGEEGWSDTKYAIIMPFTEVPIASIGSAAPMDTFVVDNVSITPDTYILCPVEDLEIVKSQNPNAKVITYDGQSVSGFANLLISKLGHKVEDSGMWGWGNKADNDKYLEIIKKAGIDCYAPHSMTKEHVQEDRLARLDRFTATLGVVNNEKLIQSDEDFINIRSSLIYRMDSDLSMFLVDNNNYNIYNLEMVTKKIDTIIGALDDVGIVLNEIEKKLLHNVVNISNDDLKSLDFYSKIREGVSCDDRNDNLDYLLELEELVKADFGQGWKKEDLIDNINFGFYSKDCYIPNEKDNTRSEFMARVILLAAFRAMKRGSLSTE